MAGRRTNLALIVLLAAAFVTGVSAFGVGAGGTRWIAIAHGVAGFAIVLLAPWKSVIARRGLKRTRPGKGASVALSVVAAVALCFGVFHSSGVLVSVGPVTAMQIHVGAALIALPLSVWHVFKRRVSLHRTDLTRRQLAKAGVLLAGAGATYAAMEGSLRVLRLPGRGRRSTGSYERGSFTPTEMPVTQWLNDPVPAIDPARWELRVVAQGCVGRSFSLDELAGYDDRLTATLDCTGGWFAHQEWRGAWLSRLIPADVEGRSVIVRSVTGYDRRFPLSDADRLLIAISVGGNPLSSGHGAPARLVAPGRRGFWWVKWLDEVSISDSPPWAQWPFPVT